MTCTDPIFSTVFPASTPTPFLIFASLNFEHGELTDLAETSGNCNLLNYDMMGNSATVPNPDPYLKGTRTRRRPACSSSTSPTRTVPDRRARDHLARAVVDLQDAARQDRRRRAPGAARRLGDART